MATELARQVSGGVEVLHGWTPVALREAIAREVEMRSIVLDYYRGCMQENHHFYRLTEDKSVKPALSKEGALNLCSLFKVTPMADLPVETFSPDGHYTVRYRVDIISKETGEVVARGDGLCTSRESKYAYRNAARVCPVCGKGAIIKGREDYGGGWLCFRKREGCGAKFPDGDQTIEGQPQGRVENEDKADQYNTVLKMAEKRATVDAVLKLPLVSELFTQDLEEAIQGRLQAQYHGEAEPSESERAPIEADRHAPKTTVRVTPASGATPAPAHPTKEQLAGLRELARSVDPTLDTWVPVMRQMLGQPQLTTATDGFLRSAMTMGHYEAVWAHYQELVGASVQEAVPDVDYEAPMPELEDLATTPAATAVDPAMPSASDWHRLVVRAERLKMPREDWDALKAKGWEQAIVVIEDYEKRAQKDAMAAAEVSG